MTTIKVDENWKIKIDSNKNHQLVRFKPEGVVDRGKTKGQISPAKWVEMESYHRDIRQALGRIIDIELAEEENEISLEAYFDRYEALVDKFISAKLEVME